MAPEKGLPYLVDAFIELNRRNPGNDSILDLAGWMGPQHQEYWQKQVEKLNSAGLSNRYTYHGSVDRQEKVRFLSAIDLLCVPTEYQEPKGLFVLEGIACGVPYLLPNHGAFPELHERLQFGSLFQAKDRDSLVQSLERHTQVPRLDVDERSRQRNARIERDSNPNARRSRTSDPRTRLDEGRGLHQERAKPIASNLGRFSIEGS